MKESAILESSAIVADVLGAPAVAQVNARILCELMGTIHLLKSVPTVRTRGKGGKVATSQASEHAIAPPEGTACDLSDIVAP